MTYGSGRRECRRRTDRPLWRAFAGFILVTVAYTLASCTAAPVVPYVGTAPRRQTLYVVDSGWHTEIGLAIDKLSPSLATLAKAAPDVRYVVFGWGQRDYYMAEHPGSGDLIGAAVPSPAVVLMIPLNETPATFFADGSKVFAVPTAQGGLDHLSRFIHESIRWTSRDRPERLGAGPYPASSFYASTETYSLVQTCNTWTAEALRVAGLPVSTSGVIFARQVIDQVRNLARPAP
jgi:uncharacterized protein (TIGR02117 family)